MADSQENSKVLSSVFQALIPMFDVIDRRMEALNKKMNILDERINTLDPEWARQRRKTLEEDYVRIRRTFLEKMGTSSPVSSVSPVYTVMEFTAIYADIHVEKYTVQPAAWFSSAKAFVDSFLRGEEKSLRGKEVRVISVKFADSATNTAFTIHH